MAFARSFRIGWIALASPLIALACAEGVSPGTITDGSTAGSSGSGGLGTAGLPGVGGFATGGFAPMGGGAGGTGTTNGGAGGTSTGGTSTGGAAGTGGAPIDLDAGSAKIGDLVLEYLTADDPQNNVLKPQFDIINKGTTSVPLRTLTIRYYYTADGPSPGTTDYQQLTVDYADIGRITNGGTSVTLSFGPLKPAEPKADTYLEVGFTGTDSLAPGEATNQIQVRVNWLNYTVNYDETNDYSWDGTKTTFTPWQKITLYQRGVLIWGVEPDGTRPKAPPGSGKEAGADSGSDAGAPAHDAGAD